MATETIGSTGDRTDINAWVSVNSGSTSGIETGQLINEKHTFKQSVISGLSGTVDDNHHWVLTVVAADRHAGNPTTDKQHFDHEGSNSVDHVITNSDNYTEIEYVQFTDWREQWSLAYAISNSGTNVKVSRCIFFDATAQSSWGAAVFSNANINCEFHNNLIHNIDNVALYQSVWASGNLLFYNNSIHRACVNVNANGCDLGGTLGVTFTNNICTDLQGTGICYDTNGATTITTCVADDTSGAPDELDNKNDGDMDWNSAGDNFQIGASSAAYQSGTDDLGLAYQTDIAGNDRGTTNWDCGCWLNSAAGAATRRRVRMGRRR